MSQEENIDTWTEMTKSVCDILSADAKHLQRLKDDRDDWKNRYFKQAERLDSIQIILRGIENDVSQMNSGFTFVCAVALVNFVALIALVVYASTCGG